MSRRGGRTIVIAPALTSSTHWHPPDQPGGPWRKVTTNDVLLARWPIDLDGLAAALAALGLFDDVDAATRAVDASIVPNVGALERAIGDCFVRQVTPKRRGAPQQRVLYRELAEHYARRWYPRVLDLALAAEAQSFETEPTYRDIWAALTTPDDREYTPVRQRERMLFEIRTKRGDLPLWELWLRHWPRLHPADKVAQRLTALDQCEDLATVRSAIERFPFVREIRKMRDERRDRSAATRQKVRDIFNAARKRTD